MNNTINPQSNKNEFDFQLIFEKAPSAISIIKEGQIIAINEAFAELIQCESPKEFMALKPSQLSPEYQPDDTLSTLKEKEMLTLAQEHGHHVFEWAHIKHDETILIIEVNLTYVGHSDFFLSVWADMTDQKAEAQRVKLRNIEFSNIINEKSIELIDTYKVLKIAQSQLFEAKKLESLNNIILRVTQELSTPIGTSLTYSTYIVKMLEKLGDSLKSNVIHKKEFTSKLDSITQASNNIHDSIYRSSQLIEQFNYLNAKTYKKRIHSFEIKYFIKNIVNCYTEDFEENNITFNLSIDDYIIYDGDANIIYVIFQNLIQNSIIHAFPQHQQGNISISISQQNAMLIIEYTDDGIGIEKEYIEKIFDPFYTTLNNKSNLGIGLSIVYNYVIEINGNIRVKSNLESGFKAFIQIPVVN